MNKHVESTPTFSQKEISHGANIIVKNHMVHTELQRITRVKPEGKESHESNMTVENHRS